MGQNDWLKGIETFLGIDQSQGTVLSATGNHFGDRQSLEIKPDWSVPMQWLKGMKYLCVHGNGDHCYNVNQDALDKLLTSDRKLSDEMQVHAPFRLGTAGWVANGVSVSLKDGVYASIKELESLDVRYLDFINAHERAHIKLGHYNMDRSKLTTAQKREQEWNADVVAAQYVGTQHAADSLQAMGRSFHIREGKNSDHGMIAQRVQNVMDKAPKRDLWHFISLEEQRTVLLASGVEPSSREKDTLPSAGFGRAPSSTKLKVSNEQERS